MNRLIEFFVKQKIFSDLIVISVMVLGIACMLLMRREAFPNINFDLITINTIFPGASPDEVERLITNPLEIELKEVTGIKKIRSVSRSGTSMIFLQLDPDQTTETEAKTDVQDVVDRFTDLPDSAERPIVTTVESATQPIIQVSVTGDQSPLELRNLAREIEKDLETIANVAKVTPTGMQDLEIHVETELSKLANLGLSFESLIAALRNQNMSIPGGTLTNPAGEEIFLRTSGDFETIEQIENTVIRANELAQGIRIKDVAKVSYQLKDDEKLFRTNGEHAINLTILRKQGADSITVVDLVKKKVKELESKYAGRAKLRLIDDESVWIKMRLNTLTGNFLLGLVLVLIILSLLLPPMIALMVALGVPFAFFATMIVFYNIDYSLNLLSMLGLIIVVGMLVDDAVVATENSMRLFEDGMPAEEAAIKGTQQVVPSVFGSVMTTVLAFAPLMFMSGIFGKFVKFIPMGVIVALMFSLFEAYFILPGHFARWVRVPSESEKSIFYRIYERSHKFWLDKIVPRYRNAVILFVRRRYRAAGVVALLFAISLVVATRLSFVLFPAEGIEIFFIAAEAPLGTKLEKTGELLRPLEKLVLGLPKGEVQDFTTQIGMQMKDPHDPTVKFASHVGLVVVYLTPVNERDRTANEIIASLREQSGSVEDIKFVFEKVNPGPPVGKPISIAVQGESYEEILQLGEIVKAELLKISGVSDLELTHQQGNKEIRVEVQQAEAAAAGINVATIGQSVRAAFEGIVPTSIKRLDEEVDIRVLLPDQTANNPQTLANLQIPNPAGNLIRLGRVAKFSESQAVAAHIHEGNRREVRVLGQIDATKTDSGKVNAHIEKMVPEFKAKFPRLTLLFGGENEDTNESMKSLMRTFIVAFIGILFILILTFQQILQPLLVALTIPIGLMAVIYAFLLHGQPLSFMGILGTIALAGVIVNNAIVLMDFVNYLRLEGQSKIDSIINAAEMRLRPIFLTTVTTVAGVLPTAYGIGGVDEFVKPIALALGWGLLLGSIITVFFFPVMIAILDDLHGFVGRKFRRRLR